MARCLGHVGAAGRLLTVTMDGRRWMVLIRRLDGACDAALMPFHGRSVSGPRLKVILPTWPHFCWTHHPAPSAGLPLESRALVPPYQITLIYPPGTPSQPDDVVEELITDLAC